MPSGSHGGHTHSGGARVGGSSHSGGFHGGYGGVRYAPRPWRFHFGHHYYVVPTRYSGLMSLFSVLMIFAVFFIFAGSIMLTQAKDDLGRAQRDYDRYQAMIVDARMNPDLLVIGEVTNHYYDDTAEKWYMTYTFATHDGGKIDGYSFPVYTAADLQKTAYRIGADIELALDRVPEHKGDDVDSVPTDYANFPLEQDGYYIAYRNTRNVGRIMLIVAVSVLVGSIVLNIVLVATTKKRDDAKSPASATNATTTTGTTGTTATAAAPERKSLYCEYCGALLEMDDKKCPGCGAKVKR